jgi:hypothetical protein
MKNLILALSLFAILLTGTIHTMEQTFTYDKSLCTQGCETFVLRNLNIFTQQNQNETSPQTKTNIQNAPSPLAIGTSQPKRKQREALTSVPAQEVNKAVQKSVTIKNVQKHLPIIANAQQLQAQSSTTDQIIVITQDIHNLNRQIYCEWHSLELKTQVFKPYYPMQQILSFFQNEKISLVQKIETRNQLVQRLGQLKLELTMFQSH